MLFFAVFLLEFLHTAGGIDQHFLAGEKGMRRRTNLDFNNRVFFAIGKLDFLLGHAGRTAQKLKIA